MDRKYRWQRLERVSDAELPLRDGQFFTDGTNVEVSIEMIDMNSQLVKIRLPVCRYSPKDCECLEALFGRLKRQLRGELK